MFQTIIVIYIRGKFVYYHWGCILFYLIPLDTWVKLIIIMSFDFVYFVLIFVFPIM